MQGENRFKLLANAFSVCKLLFMIFPRVSLRSHPGLTLVNAFGVLRCDRAKAKTLDLPLWYKTQRLRRSVWCKKLMPSAFRLVEKVRSSVFWLGQS